jgi:RNA polymerase sigma factor (sigma-70 family)
MTQPTAYPVDLAQLEALAHVAQAERIARQQGQPPGPDVERDARQFYGLCQDYLERLVSRCHLADADRADVVQEVLLRLVRHLPQFRWTDKPGRFNVWLAVMLHRQAADHYRRLQRRPADSLTDALEVNREPAAPTETPLEELLRGEASARVAAFVASLRESLPAAAYRLFEVLYLEGHQAPAAAVVLGWTVQQLRDRRSHLLRRVHRRVRVFLLTEE